MSWPYSKTVMLRPTSSHPPSGIIFNELSPFQIFLGTGGVFIELSCQLLMRELDDLPAEAGCLGVNILFNYINFFIIF
jgi:hypothetical protein